MKPIIYKITNKVNEKVYIGQTTQGLIQRQREHLHRFRLGQRDHKLYLAFKKYGIANFAFAELCSVLDANDLNVLEIAFIAEYNSFNHGYNATVGGCAVSEETKEKISKRLSGRRMWWADKVVTARRQNGTLATTSLGFSIKDPRGVIHVGKNIAEFCRKYKLDRSNLQKTLVGTQRTSKGFVLIKTFNDYPGREYSQTAGNGVYPVALTG